jgi:hypothetical protein
MIDMSLPNGLIHWLNDNRDWAYLGGFVVICLNFYGLYPFTIGLSYAASAGIPFKSMDIGKEIRKRHRVLLAACAILVFTTLHLGLSMPDLAAIGGGTLIGVLIILDHVQIYREYPPRS